MMAVPGDGLGAPGQGSAGARHVCGDVVNLLNLEIDLLLLDTTSTHSEMEETRRAQWPATAAARGPVRPNRRSDWLQMPGLEELDDQRVALDVTVAAVEAVPSS